MRKYSIKRKTKETNISVDLSLDGNGKNLIETGIGFLDHMLEQLSKHSLFDINVKAKGDLHIDFHHTTEDSALALGEAFSKSLGDRKGIKRFGRFVCNGRNFVKSCCRLFKQTLSGMESKNVKPKLGEMDTELFKEWFQAFSQTAGITLHIENLYGENNHHIIESCFKGLARALREAVVIDPRQIGQIPSTKGKL